MVTSALVAVLSLQGLDVTATIDRDEIGLGDEIALTIIVEGRVDLPVAITDPPLNGFEVIGMSDRSTVSIQGGESGRTTTRVIRLRAIRAGRAIIGPVRVEQGDVEVTTRPINLTVTSAAANPAVVPEHVRRIVQRRAPPPLERDEVFVEVLVSSGEIILGEQLDLIVLAWFPRHVRSRLRNPPRLEPPQLQGAWAFTQGAPGAIATGRSVGGAWYDVYVHSQVAFPLNPGEFGVGPATVSYNLPLTYSFLSRELRHEVQSDSVYVTVQEQPRANRPFAFDGAVGQNLDFTLSAERTELALGEAVEVVATLSGQGNVALWPEPRFRWPTGLRVYPERVDVELTSDPRSIGGTKNFYYLVVADSVGSHRVPPVDYPYFDLDSRSYRFLEVDQLEFLTKQTGVVVAQSARPTAPLLSSGGWFNAGRWVRQMPVWVWILVAALPPLLALLARVAQHFRWRRAHTEPTIIGEIDRLDDDFRNALADLVAHEQVREGDGLADALRAAGVEAPVATQAARVRERLWRARYGPEVEVDVSELAAETTEVLHALVGIRRVHHRAHVVGVILLVCLFSGAGQSAAQSAERLYETGAIKSAADSFAVRAREEPWAANHWHDLGITLQRLGAPAEARAALVRAARLRPRDATINQALSVVSTPDRVSRRLTWVSILAPAEAIFLAALVWITGWSLALFRMRRRWTVAAVFVALMLVGYAGYAARRYDGPVAFVLAPDTRLRLAPYGTAPGNTVLHEAMAVRVSRIEGSWVLVEHGGSRGWLLMHELVTL